MMLRAAITGALVLVPAAALALEEPTPASSRDTHVCVAPYDENNVLHIKAAAGNTVTLIFSKDEMVGDVNPSDTVNIKWTQAAGDTPSTVYMKAVRELPLQPGSIRTIRKSDGSFRYYTFLFEAFEPTLPRLAAAGDITVAELKEVTSPCYTIRYTYGADKSEQATAEQTAKWRAAAEARRQQKEEQALRDAEAARPKNYRYVGVGDAELAPTAIWDDGYTTHLDFPGNMAIPIILVVNRDGKEAEPSGITVEDHGIVKLHSVVGTIRLLDGDKLLCIINRGYSQIGNNPGTGTTSSSVERDVRRDR